MDERNNLCPVTSVQGGTVFVCTKPRNHIRLLLVKAGDKRLKFTKMPDPHVFKAKHSIL